MTTRSHDLGLPEDVELLPQDWPCDGVPRPLLPGDLSQFAANQGPQKTDLAKFHPFRFDPKANAGGGLIYFDEYVDLNVLKATLGLMGVYQGMRDYAVFAACSSNPAEDDFLDQMRFVSHHSVECGNFIWNKPLPEQTRSVWELIEVFIAGQRSKWNRAGLSGTRGGDGESAKETLGFGFMVEDTEWRIYRIWSRSWLVLK